MYFSSTDVNSHDFIRTLTSDKSDVGRPVCLINNAASFDKNILETAKKAQL